MKMNLRDYVGLSLLAALPLCGCSGELASDNVDRPEQQDERTTPASAVSAIEKTSSQSNETAVPAGPEDLDAILEKYVEGNYFKSAGLKANADDMKRFDALREWQANANLSGMSRERPIAFYINAYNACAIKAILDHYPVKTPQDVPGLGLDA